MQERLHGGSFSHKLQRTKHEHKYYKKTVIESVKEYLPILIFFVIAIGLAVIMLVIPFIVAKTRPYKAKIAPYECGFAPFSEPRSQFNVSFYMVAILFIIFDLEIAFLFPWAIVLKQVGLYGFVAMMIFLSLLLLGFIYEWVNGALEWD